MIEQAEAASLLQEFPKLQKFNNLLKTIEKLKDEVAQEQDPEMIRDDYETILRLKEKLSVELMTYIAEEYTRQFKALEAVCCEWMGIVGALEEILRMTCLSDGDADMSTPIEAKSKGHLKLIKK